MKTWLPRTVGSLLHNDRKSAITSFRNNRFNNYLKAAAALHFYWEDIHGCLQSLQKINRKLESIQEDNRSDEIDCQLIALGLLFYRVTGPYWELLSRDVHCLDFCIHVVRMHDFLQKWADNAVDAFADQFKPLFGTKFMASAPIFRAMLDSQQETKEVKRILNKLCKGCLETTKTQLADFFLSPEAEKGSTMESRMTTRGNNCSTPSSPT